MQPVPDAPQRAVQPDVAAVPPQLAMQSVRLSLADVPAVRRGEAARGPPRSLHRLARDALQAIAKDDEYCTVNLDNVFPWIQYIAAHARSNEIIGPGITEALAVFVPETRDANRGGAPRLDFVFNRTDGTRCRVHPGNKPKLDAKLVVEVCTDIFV